MTHPPVEPPVEKSGERPVTGYPFEPVVVVFGGDPPQVQTEGTQETVQVGVDQVGMEQRGAELPEPASDRSNGRGGESPRDGNRMNGPARSLEGESGHLVFGGVHQTEMTVPPAGREAFPELKEKSFAARDARDFLQVCDRPVGFGWVHGDVHRTGGTRTKGSAREIGPSEENGRGRGDPRPGSPTPRIVSSGPPPENAPSRGMVASPCPAAARDSDP